MPSISSSKSLFTGKTSSRASHVNIVYFGHLGDRNLLYGVSCIYIEFSGIEDAFCDLIVCRINLCCVGVGSYVTAIITMCLV